MSEQKILAAEWVLPVSAPPIRDGAVIVRDERILGVGPKADLVRTFRDVEVLDFGHASILPGFVNTHTHLELTALRGYLEEPQFTAWLMKVVEARRRLTEEDLVASALAGVTEAIHCGITTLADIGYSSSGFEGMRRGGVRGVFFQETICFHEREVDHELALLQGKIEPMLAQQSKRLRVGVSPHSPYSVCPMMFDRVAGLIEQQPMPISIHAAESLQELEFFSSGTGDLAGLYVKLDLSWDPPGCTPIAYLDRMGMLELRPILAHCVQISSSDLEMMRGSDCSVAHCPKSNAKLGHGTMPLMDLIDAQIRVGLGTDSAGSNNSLDMIDEARFCGLLHRALRKTSGLLPADELIRLITIDGARALGLADQIGTLEPGKQADLIAVDLSRVGQRPVHDVAAAILFASSAQDVKFSMVGGEILMFDGRIRSVSEDEVLQRINRVGQRLPLARPYISN